MDPVAALHLRGGSATWAQLAPTVARGTLLRALRDGLVRRPVPGVFAVPDADPAQVGALAVGGEICCASAAAARGWELLHPPARLHLRAPRGSRRTWRGAVVHRVGPVHFPGAPVPEDETIRWTLRCLPTLVERVVFLDGLLRNHIREVDDLLELGRNLPRKDARHRALALMDPAAGSVLESAMRVGCTLAGLDVRTQEFLDGVGWVDLLVEGWLVVETDGRQFHADRFVADRRRDVSTAVLGGMTLRFSDPDVRNRLEESVEAVRAVARAGPPGEGLTRALLPFD